MRLRLGKVYGRQYRRDPKPTDMVHERTLFKAAVAAAFALWAWVVEVRGQADAWVTSTASTNGTGLWTNMFDASPGTAVALPAPGGSLGYNGAAAKYSNHIRTNGDGQIIFFEVDGNLYDGDGYLIADAREVGCTECLEPGVMEFVSVAVPELCGVYYLLASKVAGIGSVSYHIQVSVLDMNADNTTYGVPLPNGSYERKGRLLDLDTELITLYPQFDPWVLSSDCLLENENLGTGQTMPTSTHVGKLAVNALGKSQSPLLRVVAGQTPTESSWLFAIYTTRTLVYKITENGITKVSPMQPGPDAPPDLGSVPTYHTNDNFTLKEYYRDADARFTTNGEIRVVQTDGLSLTVWQDPAHLPYNLLTMRFNATTGMLIPNSIEGYSLFEPPNGCDPSLQNSGLAGCALRPGGGGVYVVGNLTSDCVTSAPQFGYLDFLTGFTDLTATVPSVGNYVHSRFYRNQAAGGSAEAIYIPRLGGVDAITGIDDPNTVVNVVSALPSAVPPVHIDQPGQESGNLQPAFLNPAVQGDLHLSTSNTQEICCTYFQTTHSDAVSGYTHTGFATWTAANNGFGDQQEVTITADVVIPYNTTLNVYGMTWRFTPNAKLIVERGGRVTFNNCTLTSMNCPNARWPGARVEGTTANGYQAPTPLVLSLAQGRMWLFSTVIENAVVGTWCARELSGGSVDGAYYGGVVRAYNSTYRNCISGVRVENYHRYEVTLVEMDNLCYFLSTSFRTTASWPDGLPPFRHAQVVNCKGVSFINCNWVNEIPLSFAITQRGRGIVSRQAPFRCTGNMNANNRFENLEVGVLTMQMPTGRMYTVDGMTFFNNFKGVVDMGTHDAVIINNKFTMLAMPTPFTQTSIGIHLFQSNLYTIERNTFTDQGTSVPSAGIWFMGPAIEDNRIYDNTFTDLNMACVVQGRHLNPGGIVKDGLQMLCGDHEGNLVDQWLWADAYIKENQGGASPQVYANNQFNSIPDCINRFEPFVNWWHPFDTHIKYHYWDWDGGDDPQMRPECVEDEDNVSSPTNFTTGEIYHLQRYNQQDPFNKEDDCDEGDIDDILGGGLQQIDLLTGAYRAKQAELRSAVNSYRGTVDQGFTESLEETIDHQPWHPSFYLRDYMLMKHPLSDKVILAAIHRAEPMDPWHLTQVLIQNSPLSPAVYDEIELTGVLPQYFYNMLKQYDEGLSLRDLLEAEISGRQIEKSRLLHRLFWVMSEDSLTSDKHDTLISVLEEDSLGMGATRLYQYYMGQLDFAAAAALAPELVLNEMTEPLVQLGTMYEAAQGDWNNTTAAQREELFDLAFDHASNAGADAWSALIETGDLDSLPTPELPEAFKSLFVRNSRYGQAGVTVAPAVAAFPNPAQDRVQITYGKGMEHGTLQLFDAQGRLMIDFQLNGQLAFMEVPVKGFAEGLYLVRIVLDGFVLGDTKFTVVR